MGELVAKLTDTEFSVPAELWQTSGFRQNRVPKISITCLKNTSLDHSTDNDIVQTFGRRNIPRYARPQQ